jgi:hypothetical protein
MSSKSDRDNRSNQLNPNNDAYHSSREHKRSGEDDDVGGGRWERRFADEMGRFIAQEERRIYEQERDRPEVGVYVGVFVGLDGTRAFLPIKLSAKPFMGNRQSARACSEDFAELIVEEIGRQLILRWGCPLALQTVFDSEGKDMFWSGYQYPIGCGSANRARHELLWREHGEKAVANARALLGCDAELSKLRNTRSNPIEPNMELARSWHHSKLKQIAEKLIADHIVTAGQDVD